MPFLGLRMQKGTVLEAKPSPSSSSRIYRRPPLRFAGFFFALAAGFFFAGLRLGALGAFFFAGFFFAAGFLGAAGLGFDPPPPAGGGGATGSGSLAEGSSAASSSSSSS